MTSSKQHPLAQPVYLFPSRKQTIWQRELQRKQKKHTAYLLSTPVLSLTPSQGTQKLQELEPNWTKLLLSRKKWKNLKGSFQYQKNTNSLLLQWGCSETFHALRSPLLVRKFQVIGLQLAFFSKWFCETL